MLFNHSFITTRMDVSCRSQKEDYLSGGDLPEWTNTSDVQVTAPLTLEEVRREPVGYGREARCLHLAACGRTFRLPEGEADLLEHLLVAHRVLVSEPNMVSDLAGYLDYWRRKLESGGASMAEFCSVVKADVVEKKQKGRRNKKKPEEGRTVLLFRYYNKTL